jgi:hypothetical protein
MFGLIRTKLILPSKLLFGTAWTIFAAEVFLRVLAPVPVVPRYVMAGHNGIRVNVPNLTYYHRSADYHIQIHTNAEGMRCDQDIPYAKPPGVKRIVVLGDSFAMGYEVDYENTFLMRMENALRAQGHAVQIVNLAVSGYGNAEELICLRAEGMKYQPDLVLLCWNETDFDDNVRSALYRLNEKDELERLNKTYLPGVAVQEQLDNIPGYDWVQANLDLYSFVRETVSYNILKPMLLALHRQGNTPASTGELPPPGDNYMTDLTVALLREIGNVANSGHSNYLILDIPMRDGNTRFHSVFPRDASGGAYGLPTVSPINTFTEHCDEGLIYWTRSQGHFTPLGCRLLGALLASEIDSRRLLEPIASTNPS